MGKYKIVSRPYSCDTSVSDEDFETVKEAVDYAMSMMWGGDFIIVTVVNWTAIEEVE